MHIFSICPTNSCFGGGKPPTSASLRALGVLLAGLAVLAAACSTAPEPDATVTMTEMVIRGPERVTAGTSVWEVVNTGRAHHNLTVCPGELGECAAEPVVQRLVRKPETARDPDTIPDETDALVLGDTWEAIVELDLDPGRYRLYCAVPNHAPKGMETVVDVD